MNCMQKEYETDFIAVPLMLDLSYTMAKPYGEESKVTPGRLMRARSELGKKTVDNQSRFISWLGRVISPHRNRRGAGAVLTFLRIVTVRRLES